MAIEFIRLKITRPGESPLQLFGSVVLHAEGVADLFGDAVKHGKLLADLLNKIRVDVPFSRLTLADLRDGEGTSLLVDTLRLGDDRFIGPLLLRDARPPAVGAAVDAAAAARIHRELQCFAEARGERAAAGRAAA